MQAVTGDLFFQLAGQRGNGVVELAGAIGQGKTTIGIAASSNQTRQAIWRMVYHFRQIACFCGQASQKINILLVGE